MDERTKRVASAVFNPLTLAVSAAGTATFVVSGLWWIVPLTAAAAALLSATQYRALGEVEALPKPYADREKALVGLASRGQAALEQSGEVIRAALADVPAQLEDVKRKVRWLLLRQARIDGFLSEKQHAHMAGELRRLEAAHAGARTPEARDKFGEAVANQRAELDARDGLGASSERVVAELAAIETALASTLAKIVALESLHDEEVRASGAGIAQELGEMLEAVGELEEALSETFDPQRRRVRVR